MQVEWLEIFTATTTLLTGYIVGHKLGSRAERKEISVHIIPFYKSVQKSMLSWKKQKIQFGYYQQLLIKGIPGMEPVEIIVREQVVEEIDEEKLASLASRIVKDSLAGTPLGLLGVREAIPFDKAIKSLGANFKSSKSIAGLRK